MADRKDPRWKKVQGAFKRLANVLESQSPQSGAVFLTMSSCWGVINFIDHDQDSEDITKRLGAIERAIDTLAAHFHDRMDSIIICKEGHRPMCQ